MVVFCALHSCDQFHLLAASNLQQPFANQMDNTHLSKVIDCYLGLGDWGLKSKLPVPAFDTEVSMLRKAEKIQDSSILPNNEIRITN